MPLFKIQKILKEEGNLIILELSNVIRAIMAIYKNNLRDYVRLQITKVYVDSILILVLPAANAFSLPVITMAPIAGSLSKCPKAWYNSLINPLHSAFKALGLFKVMRPILFFSPAVSILMNSKLFVWPVRVCVWIRDYSRFFFKKNYWTCIFYNAVFESFGKAEHVTSYVTFKQIVTDVITDMHMTSI